MAYEVDARKGEQKDSSHRPRGEAVLCLLMLRQEAVSVEKINRSVVGGA